MEDIACTMDVRLREQWDSLRSSYWFVQAVMTAGAVIGWIAIDTMDRLLRATATLQAGFVLGHQRTLVQDIDFGINKLVEVALRARAPAINDPFTAITCLDWLGCALCQLCARTFPAPTQYDAAGRLRLLFEPLTFEHIVDAAFNQIRECGRTSTAVTLHLLETIAIVASCARTDDQRAVLI